MEKRKKGLFILFEGLPPSVIDSQVLQHVNDMRVLGIDFEIWTFTHNDFLYQQALSRKDACEKKYCVNIQVCRSVRPGIPFSENINAFMISRLLRGKSFDIIHARTEYSAAVMSCLSPRHPYIWDHRGDTLSETIYLASHSNSSKIKKIYKTWQCKRWLRLAGERAERANFVSHYLAELCAPYFKGTKTVIGCVADERNFFFDDTLRTDTRKKLGYTKNNIVFCYAGTAKSYQCLPETIALFEKIRRLNDKVKLLLVTTDEEYLRNLSSASPFSQDIIVTRARYHEMNGFLNAADYGFLLREDSPVNRVASPTKFAEYALSGLPVIMTNNIGDLSFYGQKMPWHIIIDLGDTQSAANVLAIKPPQNAEQRKKNADASVADLGRKNAHKSYRKLYSLP